MTAGMACAAYQDVTVRMMPCEWRLDEHLFRGMTAARRIVVEWLIDYNQDRRRTSPRGLTPNKFATRSRTDHKENRIKL